MTLINDNLARYAHEIEASFNLISEARKGMLSKATEYVVASIAERGAAPLIFICTHNSRRSHFAQVWAQVAAHYYGWTEVQCYSGGTAATAVYHGTLKAFASAGLELTQLKSEPNPIFAARYALEARPLILFSKKYDHLYNPQHSFGAVMTCGEADEACPFIPNALIRLPITYVDPKYADGTPEEQIAYDQTCAEIAREMFFIMSKV